MVEKVKTADELTGGETRKTEGAQSWVLEYSSIQRSHTHSERKQQEGMVSLPKAAERLSARRSATGRRTRQVRGPCRPWWWVSVVQRGWKPEERRGDRGEVDGGADSEVAFYREGGRRRGTLVRPSRRAQRSQGHVSLPRGRMGIDSAGQKGRLCKDTIWLIIWDIHTFIYLNVLYIHIYIATLHTLWAS